MQQLRRLTYTPATVEAKAKAILTKTYAVAFYGIGAAEIATDKVNHLAAVVMDVSRSRDDMHNSDWFFSSFLGDQKDLDPELQIFTRRALQICRTTCKKDDSQKQLENILQLYVKHSSVQPPPWYHDNQCDDQPPTAFPTNHHMQQTTNTIADHQAGLIAE